MLNKEGILHWCDSVEQQFRPREIVPRGEKPLLIPEEFLATAIKYLRGAMAHTEKCDHGGIVECGCVCHDGSRIILHDHACCEACHVCGFKEKCKCSRCTGEKRT